MHFAMCFIGKLFSLEYLDFMPYFLSQASDESGSGDSEQLSKLSRAARVNQHEATGGPSAGGSSSRAKDPAVHAAIQDQVSIPVRVCVQCCISCCNDVHAH